MTIPTGYRLGGEADLVEGAEVLIPARMDNEGDALIGDGGNIVCVWSYMLPGLALIRDDAAPESPELAAVTAERDALRDKAEASGVSVGVLLYAVAIACRVPLEQVTPETAVKVAMEHADRAEKAEAECLRLHADLAARDLTAAERDRLRRYLANATDEVMQSAGRYGRLDAMIKAAAVLCEIDADGAEERLSALVERARGWA